MSIDMYQARFIKELSKVDIFVPNDVRDPRVWPDANSQKGDFPAWRALFSAMCLFGHSTGYRLFSYERFFRYCERAYTERHPHKERFARYFIGDLRPGIRQRIAVWYESGMAETYLYACLVEAIEDRANIGVVLYDPRVDWKLKADLVVVINKVAMRVSAFVGEAADRPGIEGRRDEIERIRKKNTSDSAHWKNVELKNMPIFEIARTGEDFQDVNGVRLFSITSVNRLLTQLYCEAKVTGWTFPQNRQNRG